MLNAFNCTINQLPQLFWVMKYFRCFIDNQFELLLGQISAIMFSVLLNVIFVNSVDTDEMPQNKASHQGLHCLLT